MRFDARVAYGLMTVALMGFGGVMADDIDDILGDATPASTELSSTAITKPSFTVSSSAHYHHRARSLKANLSLS